MLTALRGLRHPSLRLRITAVFASAMALLLAGLGLFAYSRFQENLDRSLNQSLRAQAGDLRALVTQADNGLSSAGPDSLTVAGGAFAQVIRANGRVLDATPGLPHGSLLAPADLARARRQTLQIPNRYVRAAGGPARLLAAPVDAQGQHLVVVAGKSLRDRASALRDLRAVMLLGGPVALLLASALGYAASALSLRGVEAMRRRARDISLAEPGRRLPVPEADDELGRLAQTLNEMLARNEAAFGHERRFVADASHELRSPLAILRAELEVALDGNGDTEQLRAALASAVEETDRLSRLAEDLLTIAQADEGRLPIEAASVAVDETFNRIRHRFSQRSILADRLLVAGDARGLSVWADPLRVEQALTNLVDNALRHGDGPVVLFADRRNGSVDLHVADSGPGFPREFLGIAFERFSQPHDGRTATGSGLGLSIVRSIAVAHGGEAHVANRPGGGADAWVSLPVAGG